LTRIKICGITEIDQAQAAAAERADFIGLVFAPSRRMIDAERAAGIVKTLRGLEYSPAIVGVFVNTPAKEVNRIAGFCGLERVQLSGDESWDYCREIDLPVIKALHVSAGCTPQMLIEEIQAGYAVLPVERLAVLLDTQVKGSYGGTGQVFDFALAGEVAASYPVIMAGGLTAGNIPQIISQAKPWGVDVSSGVETGGKKDIWKIREFIRTVRKCDG
jgi:phosphoribosylanthranilate isomerase